MNPVAVIAHLPKRLVNVGSAPVPAVCFEQLFKKTTWLDFVNSYVNCSTYGGNQEVTYSKTHPNKKVNSSNLV